MPSGGWSWSTCCWAGRTASRLITSSPFSTAWCGRMPRPSSPGSKDGSPSTTSMRWSPARSGRHATRSFCPICCAAYCRYRGSSPSSACSTRCWPSSPTTCARFPPCAWPRCWRSWTRPCCMPGCPCWANSWRPAARGRCAKRWRATCKGWMRRPSALSSSPMAGCSGARKRCSWPAATSCWPTPIPGSHRCCRRCCARAWTWAPKAWSRAGCWPWVSQCRAL